MLVPWPHSNLPYLEWELESRGKGPHCLGGTTGTLTITQVIIFRALRLQEMQLMLWQRRKQQYLPRVQQGLQIGGEVTGEVAPDFIARALETPPEILGPAMVWEVTTVCDEVELKHLPDREVCAHTQARGEYASTGGWHLQQMQVMLAKDHLVLADE